MHEESADKEFEFEIVPKDQFGNVVDSSES